MALATYSETMSTLVFSSCFRYRSSKPWGSPTTQAVSAVSSVTRALMECPSPWTRKIRSTASRITTGEEHLPRPARGTLSFNTTTRCRVTGGATARLLSFPSLRRHQIENGGVTRIQQGKANVSSQGGNGDPPPPLHWSHV